LAATPSVNHGEVERAGDGDRGGVGVEGFLHAGRADAGFRFVIEPHAATAGPAARGSRSVAIHFLERRHAGCGGDDLAWFVADAVDHVADLGGFQEWGEFGGHEELFELFQVRFIELGDKIPGDVAVVVEDAIMFESAHDQSTDFGSVVDEFVGVAGHGEVAGDAVDLLGDHILVFDDGERNIHAGHFSAPARPHVGGVDDGVALDGSLVGDDLGDALPVVFKSFDEGVAENFPSILAGSPGEGLGEHGGIRVAVGGAPEAADAGLGGHGWDTVRE